MLLKIAPGFCEMVTSAVFDMFLGGADELLDARQPKVLMQLTNKPRSMSAEKSKEKKEKKEET